MGVTDGGSGGGKMTGTTLLLIALGAALLVWVMTNNRTVPVTPPGQFGPTVTVSASPSK